MQEAWVRSLGREDPLEKEMATRSSILAWKIPWIDEPRIFLTPQNPYLVLPRFLRPKILHILFFLLIKDLLHPFQCLWAITPFSSLLHHTYFFYSAIEYQEYHRKSILFKNLFGCTKSQLWYMGSSSQTRSQTWAPCIGSSESQPLDHQGSPDKQYL